jgi:hypothetical protein
MGAGGSVSEIIQPECEVQNSPPYNVQVKNHWSYTSTLPTCLHDVDSSNITFYTENVVQALLVSLLAHLKDIRRNAT